jgi:hypothetical protein
MTEGWVELMARGLVTLACTAALFAAARVRFRRGGDVDEPGDTGLD